MDLLGPTSYLLREYQGQLEDQHHHSGLAVSFQDFQGTWQHFLSHFTIHAPPTPKILYAAPKMLRFVGACMHFRDSRFHFFRFRVRFRVYDILYIDSGSDSESKITCKPIPSPIPSLGYPKHRFQVRVRFQDDYRESRHFGSDSGKKDNFLP